MLPRDRPVAGGGSKAHSDTLGWTPHPGLSFWPHVNTFATVERVWGRAHQGPRHPHLEHQRGGVTLKARKVLCHSTPVPRNAEVVRNLVIAGVLPPEVSFPESLYHDVSSTYSAWVSSLPEEIRNVLLPYLTNCSLSEKLNEVGPGWVWGPRVPPQVPRAPEASVGSGRAVLSSTLDHQDEARRLP